MLPNEPKVGWLFRYSYLWQWQHIEGREDGDKDRPVVVLAIVAKLEDGTSVVRVLPVTHSRPSGFNEAMEIPATVKMRLGLDADRSWIILTESNRFIWPGPDIRPFDSGDGYYGPLPPALFEEIKRRFVDLARSGRHQAMSRTD